MDDDTRHDLTLMTPPLGDWVFVDAEPGKPAISKLVCPICGLEADVPAQLSKAGGFYCDGTGQTTFYIYQEGMPRITEVFREDAEVSGDALEALKLIAQQARALAESLEAWIYIYGKPGRPGD